MGHNRLKIAIVADIHHGRNERTKRGEQALELLSSILVEIQDYEPDLMVDLGDRIIDDSEERDELLLNQVASLFEQTSIPRQHLLGNHDVTNLSTAQQAIALNTGFSHQSKTINGWHLIFWMANTAIHDGKFTISKDDLEWLRAEVECSTYPAVLFSHIPIGGGSYIGNYWFSRHPAGGAEYTNAAEARRIITDSDNVVLAVAGHAHWNAWNTVDGVHFVTVQSVTESYCTHPHAAGAWSSLELGNSITVTVHGNDPLQLKLLPRREGFHVSTW